MFITVRKRFPQVQKTFVAIARRRARPDAAAPPPDSTRPRHYLTALAAVALAAGGGTAAAAPAAADPEQSHIVVLKDGAGDAGAIAAAQQGKFGFTASTVYRDAVSGYSGTMTAAQANSLAADPSVDFVTLGRHFDKPQEPTAPNTEVAPFWWLRIGGDIAAARAGANQRASDDDSGVNVAVIDSGIDASHPDLNVRGGIDCTSGAPVKVTPIDVLGHGTAVAGVIGARNNASGIVGAAPGTPLWSVRVVSDAGTISEASLICAS